MDGAISTVLMILSAAIEEQPDALSYFRANMDLPHVTSSQWKNKTVMRWYAFIVERRIVSL